MPKKRGVKSHACVPLNNFNNLQNGKVTHRHLAPTADRSSHQSPQCPPPAQVNQVFRSQRKTPTQLSKRQGRFEAVFRIRISLNADPDPDPGFYLNADPDPDSGS